MNPDYPIHWQRGQLLDLKRYSDSTFRARLLGDVAEKPEEIEFASSHDAQAFVSWWYATKSYGCP